MTRALDTPQLLRSRRRDHPCRTGDRPLLRRLQEGRLSPERCEQRLVDLTTRLNDLRAQQAELADDDEAADTPPTADLAAIADRLGPSSPKASPSRLRPSCASSSPSFASTPRPTFQPTYCIVAPGVCATSETVGRGGRKSNQDSGALGKVMLELLGTLGSQETRSRLRRVAKKLADTRARGESRPGRVVCRQRPRRPGWVLKAIVQVLADREEPMRAKDIHAAIEASLGEPVSWSSIKGALADNSSGSSPRFVRIARGRYVLA
jgi:hypothetical protein